MNQILTAIQAQSPWELLAVFCALAYLLLAVKENVWCWLFAFISTVIYTILFWQVSLLMDSALNIYYLLMAVYGWYQWTRGGPDSSGEPVAGGDPATKALKIRSLNGRQQLWIITIITLLTAISGFVLSEHSNAAWPYVDSFTTWASVVTTYLVAQKYLQNWLYWIVIDSVSIPLYIDRGLAPTALLFFFYVIIVVFGYFKWKHHFIEQQRNREDQAPIEN